MKKPQGKGGRKEPATEDDEIWWQAAATIEPLKRGKPRVHQASTDAMPETPIPAPKSQGKVRSALGFKGVTGGQPRLPAICPRTAPKNRP